LGFILGFFFLGLFVVLGEDKEEEGRRKIKVTVNAKLTRVLELVFFININGSDQIA